MLPSSLFYVTLTAEKSHPVVNIGEIVDKPNEKGRIKVEHKVPCKSESSEPIAERNITREVAKGVFSNGSHQNAWNYIEGHYLVDGIEHFDTIWAEL